MANKYVHYRDGGKSNEEALSRLLSKIAGTNNSGKVGANDFKVKQNTSPNMTVLVSSGDYVIPYLEYLYHAWSTVDQSVTITAADPSFGRIDRIIAYIDRPSYNSSLDNNLDMVQFISVTGTAAASPVARDDTAVNTAVSNNPWKELARVTVDAGVTSIVDAKITDYRSQFILGGGVGGAEFAILGTLAVYNNATPYWLAPKSGTFTALTARVKTAPTGQAIQLRINKNGTQATTLTIPAGNDNASASVNIQFSQNDYFSLDITQVGSTVAGADITVALG